LGSLGNWLGRKSFPASPLCGSLSVTQSARSARSKLRKYDHPSFSFVVHPFF
jgi:hypothetical protein